MGFLIGKERLNLHIVTIRKWMPTGLYGLSCKLPYVTSLYILRWEKD